MPGHSARNRSVFLNLPFDKRREKIGIALISGIVSVGLIPRSVVELPPHANRLDRLLELVGACSYSFHDLSAVGLCADAPRVPRFNMPFELGLVVGRWHSTNHQFRILETKPHRIQKSLSDMNGFDPMIHGGTVEGVFDVISEAFAHLRSRPLSSTQDFALVYRAVRKFDDVLPPVFRSDGFTQRVALAQRAVSLVTGAKKIARHYQKIDVRRRHS